MWRYEQATGKLFWGKEFVGEGYSGTGEGRNNPAMQDVPRVGPIPKGRWGIGAAYEHPRLGPFVMNLYEPKGTDFTDRDLFRIHGDNSAHDASQGCIILDRPLRVKIATSGDFVLEVF